MQENGILLIKIVRQKGHYMRFAIGFVIYNPSEKELNSIHKWHKSPLFQNILIYDNSSNKHSFDYDNELKYFFNGKNDGLSVAYNVFIAYCIQENIDYLCLMDQDSDYTLDEAKKMTDFIEKNYIKINGLPLIAPRSYCVTSVRVQRKNELSDAYYVINSGTFLNISLLKEKNLRYDENIFLDGVDYDFCMTLHKNGFPVKVYENSILMQNLGYTKEKKGQQYVCHSAPRYYYIIKARKYTNIKNYGRLKGTIKSIVTLYRTILYIWTIEDEKKKKIATTLRAFWGLRKNIP